MTPVTKYDRIMRLLGWSTDEVAWKSCDGRPRWQVHASRSEDMILVTATTQREAWAEAFRLAGKVERAR